MKTRIVPLLALVLVPMLLALGGCARYKAQPLNRPVTGLPASPKDKSLSFTYHVFDKHDCKRYLDRDVIAKGYQPVQVTVTNNSPRSVSLSLKNFNVNCLSAEEVATRVHTSTVKRAVGYGVGALFLWPLAIPAIVDSFGSAKANERLDDDFARKALRDQIIGPCGSANGIVFVPVEEFVRDISLSLTDTKTYDYFVLTPAQNRLLV